MDWNTLYKPRTHGGLGFRQIRHLNQVALAKLCWRFINEPDYGLRYYHLSMKYLAVVCIVLPQAVGQDKCGNGWSALMKLLKLGSSRRKKWVVNKILVR